MTPSMSKAYFAGCTFHAGGFVQKKSAHFAVSNVAMSTPVPVSKNSLIEFSDINNYYKYSDNYKQKLFLSILSGLFPLKHSAKGEEEDFCIQEEAPVLDIEEVKLYLAVKRIGIAAIDLCHTGDAGFDGEDLALFVRVFLDFFREVWSWSDKTHITSDNIDNLW